MAKIDSSSPRDTSIVNCQLKDEIYDSEYQVLWSNIMDRGNYKNPSTYKNVEVLLLSWAENSDDLATQEEVNHLQSVLENRYRYSTHRKELDNGNPQRLQVRVNSIVAGFVDKCDGPNTLLIVYYAGHGRPGGYYGSLELFGQTSPNDLKKRSDSLVWNKCEELLKPAEADVLEIFDCCYAGNLGLTRGDNRLFEYLAATKEMAGTKVLGEDSFTSALIHALEALADEQPEGRFTTVELLNKIVQDTPHFPHDQVPVLSDRKDKTLAGRIMLHPLQREGSSVPEPPREGPHLDPGKRQTLTLHLDFSEKPSPAHINTLGLELNSIFEHHNLGVNRVRWGGLRSMVARAARSFIEIIERNRLKRQRTPAYSPMWIGQKTPDLGMPMTPIPSPRAQHLPQLPFVATGNMVIGTPGNDPEVLPGSLDPDEMSDEQIQSRRKRPKLSVNISPPNIATLP